MHSHKRKPVPFFCLCICIRFVMNERTSSAIGRGAKYCDKRFCLSVCLLPYLRNNNTNFIRRSAYLPVLWLGPPLMALRYFMYFRFCGLRHVIGQASTQSDVAGASWIWYRGVLLNWLTRGQHRTGGGVCCLRWSGHCYGCVRRSARCLTATWTRTRWNTPTWMTQSSPGTSSFTRSAGIVIPAWGSRSSAVRVSRPNNNSNNTSSVVMMLWWRSKSLR